jgi:hypothetical protein
MQVMNGTKNNARSIARRSRRGAAPKTRLERRQGSNTVPRPGKQATSKNRVTVAWHGLELRATGTSGFLIAVVVAAVLLLVLGEHARAAGLVLLALAHEPRG